MVVLQESCAAVSNLDAVKTMQAHAKSRIMFSGHTQHSLAIISRQNEVAVIACNSKHPGSLECEGSPMYSDIRLQSILRHICRADQLATTHDGACTFLKEQQCSIHKVKPVMCSTYPFWQQALSSSVDWNAEACRCEGITAVTVKATEASTTTSQASDGDNDNANTSGLGRATHVDSACSAATASYERFLLPHAGVVGHHSTYSKEQVHLQHAISIATLSMCPEHKCYAQFAVEHCMF
jgi:Fe-S-cluster containining protein